MTSSLRFNGIRVLFALLLGLCFVLGAHATDISQVNESGLRTEKISDVDAWPVRYTPKPACKTAG